MLTLREIAAVTGGKLNAGVFSGKEVLITGISTDSRTLQSGDLFIPLKGERFDGHAFLKEAFQKGAAVALTDHPVELNHRLIVVSDTLKALQQLAHYYRKRFRIPVVAITGSAGKTTTKECIGMALSSSAYQVRVGFGNLNNHIGVPLNLFNLRPSDECAVFELGANHGGEIKLLAEIVQPTVGVITGVYPVHLGGFGSLAKIYDAKLELADYLDQRGGTVIANGDDPVFMQRLQNRKFNVISFGTLPHCDYQISNVHAVNDHIQFDVNKNYHFKLKGHGLFNAVNALAAIATAGYFKVNLGKLSQSWLALPRVPNRFRIDRWPSHDLLIVDDSYNANPKSFQRAVESFKEIAKDRRKIIVLGDMLELGEQSRVYHEELGQLLASQKIDAVISVGPLSRFALNEFNRFHPDGLAVSCEHVEDASAYLASNLKEGDGVLIKGSHGIELHKIKLYLEERFNRSSAAV